MNTEQKLLKPCPFCGGTNIALLNGGLGNRFVHCDDCRATTDDGSEERAIAAWNRRTPAVATGGVTEARVEAAAREIYALDVYGSVAGGDVAWDDLDSGRHHEGAEHKATCIAQARAALTAALSEKIKS